jgi:hypothetical protein
MNYKKYTAYDRLEYKELIPCNCFQCQSEPPPYTYALEDLEKRLKNARSKVECNNSYLEGDVRKLIDETIEPIQPPLPPSPPVSMNLRQLIDKALPNDELLNLCYEFKMDVTPSNER